MNTPSRTEFLGKFAVNIGNDSQHFTQKIAEMKNIQGDNLSFYTMNIGSIMSALNQWFYYLPRISPFYSIKSNNDPMLLRLLAAHPNVGLSCSSRHDLETASGFIPSGRILYVNHLLTSGVLRHAAESDVGLLSIETMGDLQRVQKIFPQANVILNIAVDKDCEDSGFEMGCALDEAREILDEAAITEINIRGISFNIGCGIRNPHLYSSAIQTCSELFEFGTALGLKMDIINIGGGFLNSPLDKYDDYAAFADICSKINAALDFYFPQDAIPDLRVIAQPGRFFSKDAYTLNTRIIGKESVDLSDISGDDYFMGTQGYVYQINEGYFGAFGCRETPLCNPKCAPLFESNNDLSDDMYYGNIIGPTSDSYDIAQTWCHLPQMAVGGWLTWPKMGAYSFNTRATLEDFDIPSPPIYYYCNEEDWQVVQRLLTLEAATLRPKSIASTQLTSRRSSAAMSLLDGHQDDNGDCYGSLSDIWEAFSCDDESIISAEDEWMGQYQEPIFE